MSTTQMPCPMCGDRGPHHHTGHGHFDCSECHMIFNESGEIFPDEGP